MVGHSGVMMAMMGGLYAQDWQSDKVQEQVVEVLE